MPAPILQYFGQSRMIGRLPGLWRRGGPNVRNAAHRQEGQNSDGSADDENHRKIGGCQSYQRSAKHRSQNDASILGSVVEAKPIPSLRRIHFGH
jgi:hypothetical protein